MVTICQVLFSSDVFFDVVTIAVVTTEKWSLFFLFSHPADAIYIRRVSDAETKPKWL